MATIDELSVRISADSSKLTSEVGKAERKISDFSKSTEKATKPLSTGMVAIGTAVGNVLGNIVSKAFQSINQHMDGAVRRLDTLNNYTRVMSNLGIAAQDSNKSLKILDDGITGLPTKLDDAASATQRLVATNGNIAASTDMYLALNNAILAGGAAIETQNTALEQMMQAYSKGKPDVMEWRAFLTAMPAQLKQIATAMGYTSTAVGGDLYNALQSGEVNMNDFMFTIMKLNKEGVAGFANFATQARNATGGVATSITNLKTAITRGITQVLDVLGQSNIAGFFNGLSKAIGTAFSYVAAFVKIIKEAVAWIGALFGGSGSTSGLVKETGSAATNVDNISSGAAGVASGLNDASKAAKKLNGQLAGFDEMNVLSQQDTSGSGGSGSDGSGASGNAAIGDYAWDTSAMEVATDKIDVLVAKIKKAFKDLFGEWDFKKIGKSLKQFYDDVKKFFGNAGKIIKDVWQKYLRPFIQWSGESLLPATLNAIGGGIRLLGEIIGNVWDTFLMPFIDAFLVPIAQFTGGVIVNVLNGVGNALRGIANNSAAVETISLIVKGFITLIGLNLVAGFFTGLINAITGGSIAMSGFLGVLSKTTGGWDLFNKAGATGSGIINSLKDGVSSVVGKISALGVPLANAANGFTGATAGSQMFISSLGAGLIIMEAVVAVVLAIQTAMELIKLKTMEADLAERQYMDTTKLISEAQAHHNETIERQVALKERLDEITKTLNETNLSLLESQNRVIELTSIANEISEKYGMTLDQARVYVNNLDIASGNLTEKDRELAEAVLKLEQGETKLDEATRKVKDTQDELVGTGEALDEQRRGEVAELKKVELATLLQAGKYDELKQKMIELTQQGYEYTNANGEQVKVVGEDVENLVNFFGDQLARGQDDNAKAWRAMWQDADRNINNLKNSTGSLANTMRSEGVKAGENVGEGIGQGVKSKQGWLGSTIGSIGSSMLGVFKKQFDIHSPSKVMAQMGSYIMQGVGVGLESEEDSLNKMMSGIGSSIQDSFSDAVTNIPNIIPSLSIDNLGTSINLPEVNNRIQHQIKDELKVQKQPIELSATLQIDGKDIPVSLNFAQNMADSINRVSQLKNHSIIKV